MKDWVPRHMRRKQRAPKSQTPGSAKRSDTCQKTKIEGLPRSAYLRSRGRKLKTYGAWCEAMDKANGMKR